MALVVADRVQETTTTTGTGTYTLAGAKDGFQSFAAVGDGNTTYYACTDGTDYEIGIGTYTASGTTLARTTIIESSNSDAAVSWGSGSKDIFVTLPASKATVLDASGNATFSGNVIFDTADLQLGDDDEILLGDGNDLRLKHSSNQSTIRHDIASGALRLQGDTMYLESRSSVIYMQAVNGGGVSLSHANSTKFTTSSGGIEVTGTVTDDGATHDGDVTFTGASYNAVWDKSDNALEFANNAKAVFGTGSSLSIYGDGSNSYIVEGGTGDLRLQAANLAVQNTFGQYMIEANNGGAVNLYHNTSLKLGTESDGASIRGQLKIRNSSGTVQYTLPASDGSANQVLTTDGSGAVTFADAGGGADLYAANESSPTAQPSATGGNAIAIGEAPTASGNDSFAVQGATASGNGSISIGRNVGGGNVSLSRANSTVAIMGSTTTNNHYSTAIGLNSSAQLATVAGSGMGAMALGGSYASGTNSFAAAIANNTSSYGATTTGAIAIGDQAKSTGGFGIAIGRDAFVNAGGTDAVSIGRNATASSEGAVAIGYHSNANVKGSLAFANGRFSTTGDAQGRTYILRAATTDATATVLTSDGNSAVSVFNGIRLDSDTVITFDGVITAMQNGAQAYAGWRVEGLIVNDGGTVSLANSAITVIQNTSNWGIALTADDPNNILRITATGEASHNIRWVANIRTVEVTYA